MGDLIVFAKWENESLEISESGLVLCPYESLSSNVSKLGLIFKGYCFSVTKLVIKEK